MVSSSKGGSSSSSSSNTAQAAAYQAQIDAQAAQVAQAQKDLEAQTAAQAVQAEQLAAKQEAARVAEGLASRDSAYGAYMSAASGATDYVNASIKQEQSNAALLGIEYSLTDAQKSDRINNQFASVWSESDQAGLESSLAEWGNPEGFDGTFAVTRGANASTAAKGSETVVASTNPNWNASSASASTLLSGDDEEEDDKALGGGSTILGV